MRTNLLACRRCPLHMTTAGGVAGIALHECVCEPGYLLDPSLTNRKDGSSCVKCLAGATCEAPGTNVSNLVLDSHYWRVAAMSTMLKRCPHPTCGGGVNLAHVYDLHDNGTCMDVGTAGPYCQLCSSPMEVFDAGISRCVSCDPTPLWLVPLIFVLILLFVWIMKRAQRFALPSDGNTMASRMLSTHGRSNGQLAVHLDTLVAHLRSACRRTALERKAKILLTFFQIATQIGDVYVISYPQPYSGVMNTFAIVNLDIGRWFPRMQARCFGFLSTLEQQLTWQVLAPLVILGIGLTITRAKGTSQSSRGVPLFLWLLRKLPFIYGFFSLVYPFITSRAFRALAPCDCFEYTDGSETCFLIEDYSLICSASF